MKQDQNDQTVRPIGNHLLDAIPGAELRLIRPELEPIVLKHGDIMTDAGQTLQHVYFPTSGIISSVTGFENGSMVETAQIGTDGMIDISAVLGGLNAISRHVVQIGGTAVRAEAAALRRWQKQMPGVHHRFLSYARGFLAQTLQVAACNAVHSVQDRAARSLLMCDDSNGQDQICLTQQSVGDMLGASRSAINAVARTFQHAGLIRYNRGTITVVDRDGLMQASCECYLSIREVLSPRSLQDRPFSAPVGN